MYPCIYPSIMNRFSETLRLSLSSDQPANKLIYSICKVIR